MRLFVLYGDLEGDGPVWRNGMWAQFRALGESCDATYLSAPWNNAKAVSPAARLLGMFRRRKQEMSAYDPVAVVREQLDGNGPNVLLHIVNSARHLSWSQRLQPVWGLFSHRILSVVDTFPVDTMRPSDLQKYDLIASWCEDLRDDLAQASGIRTVFLPAHSDVLNYHSISSYRPLDLFLVGRREGRLHRPIHHHFNNVRKDSIFIDFVTRTQGARSARDEFQMLASTQAKAKATLCYQPSDRPRFAGRSPFMERWVHAWASGCTVFGTRPTGTGVSRLMNWEEAAFDLPDASDAAIELIETVLEDDHALAARRRRNVREALGRHDTRYRLRDLLHQLDVDLPAPLEQGLARLARRISEIDAGGSGESGGSGSPAGTGAAARDMS